MFLDNSCKGCHQGASLWSRLVWISGATTSGAGHAQLLTKYAGVLRHRSVAFARGARSGPLYRALHLRRTSLDIVMHRSDASSSPSLQEPSTRLLGAFPGGLWLHILDVGTVGLASAKAVQSQLSAV